MPARGRFDSPQPPLDVNEGANIGRILSLWTLARLVKVLLLLSVSVSISIALTMPAGGDYTDLHELAKGWKAAIVRATDPATK